jgi:DNA-binding NtrC family response regulator
MSRSAKEWSSPQTALAYVNVADNLPHQSEGESVLIDHLPETVFQQLLKEEGFHVFGFTNPSLAVEHFQINFKQYGLVISDLRMPGMNGYEFIKKVKEIKPEVKVFFMTALEIDDIEFRRVLPSINIDEFIDKPISANSFSATVKKYIKNETKNELFKDIIGKLDIPAGLKELLVSHNLTIEKLLNMKSSDIADILGIDQDAARLIIASVRQEVEP